MPVSTECAAALLSFKYPSLISNFHLGITAGEFYTHNGGAANYLCLLKTQKYDQYKDGVQYGGLVYGTEYELSFNPFDKNLLDHNAPCAVCYVDSRGSMLMMPARNDCPSGWIEEYHGYLMTSHYTHKTKKNSSVLIEIRSSSLAPRQTRMAPWCTLSNAHVEEICRVVHMFQVESWLALFVPSERKNGPHCISTRALRKKKIC